ncbi:MAG: DNA polymerase III subunit gamma/tau [Bryobacteraceae bacterium]|nr:DNA polymerase III subunit gamma/tau [Bryobacteraceae bacterium]
MYQVIARKYRPQTFAELVGQEHVRATLENAIAQGRIAHGYIFSGQRGTGKTTVARILARCLNCVQGPTIAPCGVCASCKEIAAGSSVDVIEIDAASNRGINEMRELRENVRYRPARDRYKVFIIDEAHQITSEAFNALLKTLEEPPEWVIFVLCTTEAHKIPATISSRCQHFSFRSVEFDDVVQRMEWICQQEGVRADAESLAVLAQAGDGSVRDSLSALDQAIACCGQELKAEEVRALLGLFSLESLHQVTEALAASDSRKMLEIVAALEREGYNLQHFCRELARYFRNLLVAKIAGAESRLIAASGQERKRLAEISAVFSEQDLARYLQLALDLYGDLQRSTQIRLHTELGLLRMVEAGRLMPIEEALAQLGGGAPPAPERPKTKAAPKTGVPAAAPRASGPGAAQGTALAGGWQQKLQAALLELGMKFTADAVAHSQVTETPNGLRFETPKDFRLTMREVDLRKALEKLGAPQLRIAVEFREAEPESDGETASSAAAPSGTDAALMERVLADPEVQRFREVFGGELRGVRDLRDLE